jgi:hypothetical protein
MSIGKCMTRIRIEANADQQEQNTGLPFKILNMLVDNSLSKNIRPKELGVSKKVSAGRYLVAY